MTLISYDIQDQVAILRINRPKVLNALNQAALEELTQFLSGIALEKQLRVVILTGSEKAFISGADIEEMNKMNQKQILEFSKLGQNVANMLETSPFITMAAINGYAFGGGLEMALGCDFIYASQSAVFGMPEVKLGIIPGFGGTQRLMHAVGIRQAKEMILTGKKITAEEALNLGLVNKLCAPDALLDACFETAKVIAQNSKNAVTEAKVAINAVMGMVMSGPLELERNIFVSCFDNKDRRDAMAAFLKKRKQ